MLPYSPMRTAVGLGAQGAEAGRDRVFTSAGTDSRGLEPGALFVAVQGRSAGEDFFGAALAAGAGGLAGRSFSAGILRAAKRRGAWLFQVRDGLEALQSLAADQRRQLECPLVAVTGSNGKTSTKDLLAHLLGDRVLATRGNFNNHLGVPLTLLRAEPGLRYAVLEAGMNHPGELALLGRILKPDLVLELNVGDAHSGQFKGGKAGVAAAKEELVAGLSPAGIAVVNHDDPWTAAMGRRFRGRSVTFGFKAGADLRLLKVRDRGAAGLRAEARWSAPWGGNPARMELRLSQGGPARAAQAAAALAAALTLGLDPRDAARRMEAYRPDAKMRQEILPLRGGATAILDAYNASPQSMEAALAFLALSAPAGRRLAVLGCMLELGGDAPRLHRALGRRARAAGVVALAALGDQAPQIAEGFGPGAEIFPADRVEDAAAFVRGRLRPGDWCLFKGSRGLAVERVYKALQGA